MEKAPFEAGLVVCLVWPSIRYSQVLKCTSVRLVLPDLTELINLKGYLREINCTFTQGNAYNKCSCFSFYYLQHLACNRRCCTESSLDRITVSFCSCGLPADALNEVSCNADIYTSSLSWSKDALCLQVCHIINCMCMLSIASVKGTSLIGAHLCLELGSHGLAETNKLIPLTGQL